MCMFSGPVESVGNTRIFARLSGHGTQFLAYQMLFKSNQPVAMILPLPIMRPVGDGAVEWINLRGYRDFFADVEKGFPALRPGGFGGGGFGGGGFSAELPQIKVQSVGDFEASFVPSLADFERLSPRFRLPSAAWQSLPQYRGYGFAVFQLRPNTDTQTVHPIAFEFVTALHGQLFFPTVHVHDGSVHPRDDFDHTLYLQAEAPPGEWRRSATDAAKTVNVQKARDLIIGSRPLYKKNLSGLLPNHDTVVPVA